MAFLEKISLHSFITSIPPGFDLMNDLKRGVEKLAIKHEVNEGIHMEERQHKFVCSIIFIFHLVCLHMFPILMSMLSEEGTSLSKSHHFLAPSKTGSLPLPLSRGLYQIPPSWWLAPGKAASLTIIKRGLTPHHESASIGHFHTDVAILGNNSFTGSLRLAWEGEVKIKHG